MTQLTTWRQGYEFVLEHRDTWRRGSGRVTHIINCKHTARILGDDYLLSDFNQMTIHKLSLQLESEGYADGTINKVIAAISTVLNHLVWMELLDKAPKFKKRRKSEGRQVFFTQEQVEQLVESTDRDLGDILLFGAYTGMRSGEVVKLKPEDIDLTNNIIMVGGTKTTVTKARNFRAVPIHERLRPVIERRMHKTLLFGEDWYKDKICRHFRNLLTECGYSKLYSYHVLRHSFATWCNTKGVPIRTIQELLGHECIETTEHYVKVTNEAKTQAILAL